MIFAGILAGGKGTRIGSKVPKQFLELNGKTILARTIDVFLTVEQCDMIYISVNRFWLEHTADNMKITTVKDLKFAKYLYEQEE